jgi:glycosyltransferase involved in cell wall biosynthesis
MACGLPIVVTNVAGCSADLVEDGCNGFVIPPRDSEKLSMAIDSILRKPELQRQMRTCSVERIQSYSPDACAAGLAAVATFTAGRTS